MSQPSWICQLSGARAAEWRDACGTDRFPVTSPVPVLARLEGARPEVQEVYFVAVEALEPGVRERIFAHLAARRGVDVADVRADVARVGLPLRAEGTSVPISLRVLL